MRTSNFVSPFLFGASISCAVFVSTPTGAQSLNSTAAKRVQVNQTESAEPANSVEQVEVKAVRIREKARVSSLSSSELAKIPGASGDPMKAIQALPGVASIDDSSSAPAVRGARPSDNLYYVDFLPVGYLFHLGGLASVFNGDLVRRFDMYGAAWSPEYGDALGAIFDVSLRRPRLDRIGGKIDSSFLGATVLAEGPIGEDKSFFISARRSWFDAVAKTGEDKTEGVTFTIPVYHDVQGRFIWELSPNNLLRVDYSGAADRLTFDVKPGGRIAQKDPVLAGGGADRKSYDSLAVVWDADFGRYGAHTTAIGQMINRDSIRIGRAGKSEIDTTLNYFRYQTQQRFAKQHELTIGAAVNARRIDADIDINDPRCTEFDPNCDLSSAPRVKSRQKFRQNTNEFYASNRWTFHPQWAAIAGFRFTNDDYLKKSYTEPRAALEWSPAATTTLSAAFGRHNQVADNEQILRDLGNPALLHLRSTHTALGITHKFGKEWSVRGEVYKKEFQDLVIADQRLNYRNGAKGTAEGLELLIKREPTARLSGFASVTLSRARRINEITGERFPFDYDQPVIVNLVALWKQSERWQYGAKLSYHSGSPYTPIVGTGFYADGRVRPIYGDINSQRLPAYHRLDLRADWKVSPKLTAYFELINAYGRKNLAGYNYSPDYKTREPVYQLPTLPSIGVQYTF
jgi:hypothetical protein